MFCVPCALAGIAPVESDLTAIIFQLTESSDLDGEAVASKNLTKAPSTRGAAPLSSVPSTSRPLPPIDCHLALPDARFSVRDEDLDTVVGLLVRGGGSKGQGGAGAAQGSAVCVVAEPGQAKGALAAAAANRIWAEGFAPGGCFSVDLQVRSDGRRGVGWMFQKGLNRAHTSCRRSYFLLLSFYRDVARVPSSSAGLPRCWGCLPLPSHL